MEHSPDDAPPLIAAPRHLRRRPFHAEIPDELLVPGVEPLPLARAGASPAKRKAEPRSSPESRFRRKRLAALLVAIFVSASIPVLIIALVFAG